MYKRGIVRIVEASVAALIVMGFLFINFNQARIQPEANLGERANDILEEVAENITLRGAVLNENPEPIENLVALRLPSTYSFEVKICDVESVCGKSTFTEGDIYSRERVISSNLNSPAFKPKKLKIFIW